MDIYVLWISVFNYPCFYGCTFEYPWISMDIHVLTCYGFSIQGNSAPPIFSKLLGFCEMKYGKIPKPEILGS